MKVINLLAGGPKSEWPEQLIKGQIEGEFIGVDRGSLRLLELGITPIVAVGDFDSVSNEELKLIKQNVSKVVTSNPVKDYTDTQLAIQYVMKHFPGSQINIYGFSGGRLDQLLTNLLMMNQPDYREYVELISLIDAHNYVSFYKPGKHQIAKIPEMKYLDFVNMEKTTLNLYDEKYTLDNFIVRYPTSFSSNEFVGEQGTFSFDNGILMVIQSRD
ncbi:thiamine diphosphokinase [Fructilactobacillus vespulae]|uniref:thiamine diphosphokinase n=1 Tax=Fructilactobacillus vespulae TaxID=1249630 RepID=UPI0039B48807